MSTLSLRLPESLHHKIRDLAKREKVSINQFIAAAVAEKTATLLTVDYLTERARRGSARLFDNVLAQVPDAPPARGDELPAPPGGRGGRKRKSTKPRRSATSASKKAG